MAFPWDSKVQHVLTSKEVALIPKSENPQQIDFDKCVQLRSDKDKNTSIMTVQQIVMDRSATGIDSPCVFYAACAWRRGSTPHSETYAFRSLSVVKCPKD